MKPVRICCFLGLSLAILNADLQAATLAEIRARGFLVVGVAGEPSAYGAAAEGAPSGFDGALIEDFARSLPFDLHRETVPSGDMGAALSSGKIDVVASSMEIAPAWQGSRIFSAPVAEATRYYVKRSGDDGIRALGDLSGRRFGLTSGPDAITDLNEFEHRLAKAKGRLGESVEFASYADAIEALASHRIDFVIGDIADLEAAIKDRGKELTIGEPVSRKIYVAWATAKDSPDIAGLVSGFLMQERKSGALDALQQKFLGRSFPDLPDAVTAQDWWTARDDKPSEFPIPLRKDPD